MKQLQTKIYILLISIIALSACGGNNAQNNLPNNEPISPTTIPIVVPTDIPPEETVELTPVRIGVNTKTNYHMTIIDGDIYDGFEIDLAKEIVARVYGEDIPIQWVPITTEDRYTSLADGQVDFLIRNTLHSVIREELVLFSDGYVLQGEGFLAMEGAGFKSPSDLDGLQIASTEFYQPYLDAIASNLGVAFSRIIINDKEELINSLKTDEVDAVFHNWIYLVNARENNDQIIFLDDTTLNPVAVALPLTSVELRDQINNAIEEIISDGTWLSLFDKWFVMEVPWNLDEMHDYPPFNK